MLDMYIIGLMAIMKPFAEAYTLVGPAGLIFTVAGFAMALAIVSKRGQ